MFYRNTVSVPLSLVSTGRLKVVDFIFRIKMNSGNKLTITFILNLGSTITSTIHLQISYKIYSEAKDT